MYRLDSLLSLYNYASRKEAKLLVKQKRLKVNGFIVSDAAIKISNSDNVEYDDHIIMLQTPIYIMMNKQVNRICEKGVINSVYADLDYHLPNNLFSVGRLDKDTTGLLLLTNDGKWAHSIVNKHNHSPKTYIVGLNRDIDTDLNKLLLPINLGDDGIVVAKKYEIINSRTISLTILNGKYHQVKRMMAILGYQVVSLHRVSIGNLMLDNNLMYGQYRFLREDELNYVFEE